MAVLIDPEKRSLLQAAPRLMQILRELADTSSTGTAISGIIRQPGCLDTGI